MNEKPVAVISTIPNPTTFLAADLAELDGSESLDPDGTIAEYRWTVRARPAASATALVGANAAHATLGLDEPGQYDIELVVVDNDGEDSEPVTVSVSALGWLQMTAEWNVAAINVDLHMLDVTHGDGALYNDGAPYDCNYQTCANPGAPLEWGTAGPLGDPWLDFDRPTPDEHITIVSPEDGVSYRALIHEWAMDPMTGNDVTTVAVRVWANGKLKATTAHDLIFEGDVFAPVAIDWPSANVSFPSINSTCDPFLIAETGSCS